MSIKFTKETLQTVKDNFDLVQDHWKEVVVDQHRTLDPHWKFFEDAEKIGGVAVFVARESEDNSVVGYAVFLFYNHLHDKTMIVAHNDAVFLRKSRRVGGVGVRLIKYCNEQLTEMGVQMINWHVKPSVDFGRALTKLGYKPHETIYTKFTQKE